MALHLKFALSLETIADEMIDKVAEEWASPFDAPTIIFSEYKLEQWFRLRWLEKRGVLANLNRKSIDKFLMEILIGDHPNKKKLSADMLRNVILAYLQKKDESGKANFEKLDGQVCRYLLAGGNSVDEHRLFDLANKLSGLFLEYETSRPSAFLSGKPGILDCWKQGNLKPFFIDKNGREAENEEWERNLYSAIFHNSEDGDSLLTKVFKSAENEFLTLPFLYEDCKRGGGFLIKSKRPVFILGLSGMGQFYRVLFQEFAKEHEVYAYIQNPCMKFWEDLEFRNAHFDEKFALDEMSEEPLKEDENSLLRAWGRAGRDSIKLWSLADDYIGGFPDDIMEPHAREIGSRDTFLRELQWMIANRTNQSERLSSLSNDESLTITSAPNRIREVENLHSEICKLLEKGKSIRDILVVSPVLEDYRTAILQVFDQNEKGSKNGVHLPFVLVDSASRESLVGDALEHLFAIKKSKSLSRSDFFALVRNPVVQAAQGIDPSEISDWEGWVSGMNIYRDHSAKSNEKEDWLCGVRRLLLSRLTDSVVGEYMPYSDMASSGNRSLNRFVDLVNDLEWLRQKGTFILKEEIAEIREFFNRWLLLNDAPAGLGGESIVFESVLLALENLNYQFAAGAERISWEILAQTLNEAAKTSEYSCGSLFVGGIPFMKFAPNRTIPVRHLFFLGANAKDFPGTKSYDSLDLRKSVSRWPGDDSSVEKNRYAFLCQLMSTSESFHISYQGMYLPKDEELYPSSVVNDLIAASKNSLGIRRLTLDETRPNSELYTERERRNKRTLDSFSKEENDKCVSFAENLKWSFENSKKLPERVSAFEMRKFLEDPFEFQVNRVATIDRADEDPEKISMEPIAVENFERSLLLKNLIAQKLGIPVNENDRADKETLRLQGTLPFGVFGERDWENLNGVAEEFCALIREKFSSADWNFRSERLDILLKDWTLTGLARILAEEKENQNRLVLVEVKEKNFSVASFLSGYVLALGLLAAKRCTQVSVCLFAPDMKILEMTVDAEEAAKRLNLLYEKMYVEKYRKIVPLSLYGDKEMKTPRLLGEKLKQAWKYFDGKNLFDLPRILSGFSEDNFEKEWNEAKTEMLALMPEIGTFMKQAEMEKTTKGKKKAG